MNYLLNSALFVLSLIASIIVAELCASLIMPAEYKDKDIEYIINRGNTNVFLSAGECQNYTDSLAPHPYLGFTHKQCFGINNIGYLGQDVDFVKDEATTYIGIYGGSVAAQFAGFNNYQIVLEEILNKCIGVNKNKYKVYNFADGSWKHPQQTIALLLTHEYIDIAISIEGFNEHYSLWPGANIYRPSRNYDMVSPFSTDIDYISVMNYNYISNLIKGSSILSQFNLTKLLLLAAQNHFLPIDNPYATPITDIQFPPRDDNLALYEKSLKSYFTIAETLGIKVFAFVQPMPQYKKLGEEEKIITLHPDYVEVVDKMDIMFTKLNEEGYKAYSLLRIYSEDSSTRFVDSIHMNQESYFDLAKHITLKLSQDMDWQITGCDVNMNWAKL
jgi:hypothetical protein